MTQLKPVADNYLPKKKNTIQEFKASNRLRKVLDMVISEFAPKSIEISVSGLELEDLEINLTVEAVYRRLRFRNVETDLQEVEELLYDSQEVLNADQIHECLSIYGQDEDNSSFLIHLLEAYQLALEEQKSKETANDEKEGEG